MRTVHCALDARGYDVHIGAATVDVIDRLLATTSLARAGAFVVVADRATGAGLARVTRALERLGRPVRTVSFDVSEAHKSMSGLDELYGHLLDAQLDRTGVIVALGGGVIGDLAGYAAATFLRGVRWIGIPSTLLAAVDSAVGGKTAINHAQGKNLIGAVHQPSLVVVDRSLFATLPAREWISGYGEMLKYGLALDADLWAELITIDPAAITDAHIERCVALKAAIVAADERDESGEREKLNFGHTIGHAIEAATSYTYYRHGEAVVLGMRAAVALSAARGHCTVATSAAIEAGLSSIEVPALPKIDPDTIVAAVARDKKKATGGATRFVLLREIGSTVSDAGIDAQAVRATYEQLASACASLL